MKKRVLASLSIIVVMIMLVSCVGGGTGKKDEVTPSPSPSASPSPTSEPGKTAEKLKDGTYNTESTHTENGWETAEAVIKDGKFTDLTFTKFDGEGNKVNLAEYPHPPAVEAMEKYPKQFIEEQDISKVDVISGATGTYESFKEVITKIEKEAASK